MLRNLSSAAVVIGALRVNVSVILQEFLDDGNGHVSGIKTYLVEWKKNDMGRWDMQEIPGEL